MTFLPRFPLPRKEPDVPDTDPLPDAIDAQDDENTRLRAEVELWKARAKALTDRLAELQRANESAYRMAQDAALKPARDHHQERGEAA